MREIGPLADENTRSHRVRLTLQDPSSAFRLGTTITVTHETAIAPYVPIPDSAILTADDKAFVWVLSRDGRHVVRRFVQTAHDADQDGADRRITSGLAAGDRVVTVGVHSLSDGQAVAGQLGADVVATKAGETHL